MFQFNIVFGILMAFLSNWLLDGTGPNAWRWMLGVEAAPAVVYTMLCFAIPESPRWLLTREGDRAGGVAVLQMIDPSASAVEIEALADEITAASGSRKSSSRFWTWRLRTPILLAFLIAFLKQLSGINAILYFAPRIFEMTGMGAKVALLQSIGIGVTNLAFTFVGLALIDRLGRRTLLYIGSFGYIASLGLCAFAFFHWAPQFKVASRSIALMEMASDAGKPDLSRPATFGENYVKAKAAVEQAAADPGYAPGPVEIPAGASPAEVESLAGKAMAEASAAAGSGGLMVMLCIFAFIAAHAVGQGAVIWVFISEIFPNRQRAEGQTLGSFTHWIFAALLTTFFPKMVEAFAPGQVFLFFGGMMVLQLVWVATMVPETKGVPLEEMEEKLGIV
jgi:MFS family permease